jgi:hypothetical protein
MDILNETLQKLKRLEGEIERLKTMEKGGGGGGGKIVAWNYAELASAQTEVSVAAGTAFDIDNLTITHSLAADTNKLLLIAMVHANVVDRPLIAIRFVADGSAIGVGTLSGTNRIQVTASAGAYPLSSKSNLANIFASARYSPGKTTSVVYKVQAYQGWGGTYDVYINRTTTWTDSNIFSCPLSNFLLIELEP